MAVRRNKGLCVVTLITGCITVFSPVGEAKQQITVGDQYATDLFFGGPGLPLSWAT